MRVTWLASALRDAGLTVVEHDGWQARGWDDWTPQCGIVHATAAARTSSDETQVRIVRDGREDLQGPIANACVDRSGRWHVLASGRCNTTLAGTSGPFEGFGNSRVLGVEACNDNLSEPWHPEQYEAYARGWAAICRRMGWAANRLVGHKEHTPGRKTDPTFDMATFRGRVAAYLAGEDEDMTPEQDSMLREVHSLLTTGKRLGPAQTAGGGVPIADLPRQFWEVDGALSAVQQAQARIEAKLTELAADDGDAPVGQLTAAQVGEIVNAEVTAVFARAATSNAGTQ